MLKPSACERKKYLIKNFLLNLIINKMKSLELNTFGVIELNDKQLLEVGAGDAWGLVGPIIQVAVIVLNAWANTYVRYSVATGGQYVIHHAY
jgi:hypothetical protein